MKTEASTRLPSGVQFVSDADLEAALSETDVSENAASDVLDDYRKARIDALNAALAVLALAAATSLFFADRIPKTGLGAGDESDAEPADPGGAQDVEPA